MDRVTLFEEYRLVERSETEINGAWKGAHLLLFFMAFVFGSFCTFCFHMLMYLFDEKCVLFPKLQSLTSLRHNVIYEFIPANKEAADMLPVDFLTTQWVEKSACYLPTYVPLVSAIFGLVWTTMFLMCSTGSRTLTGLQRTWRVLPPVFLFSLAMSGLCIYASAVTHYGLQELCLKLGEITGSPTCTYTINVATLAYERRIRGVYQATKLTILSAWLHTGCWLLSALLALFRVLMVVDFQLVRVSAELVGNIDRIMETHETQIRSISPDVWYNSERDSTVSIPMQTTTKVQFRDKRVSVTEPTGDDIEKIFGTQSDSMYFFKSSINTSELSLVPEERNRLARLTAYKAVEKQYRFIVRILYDLVERLPESESASSSVSSINVETSSKEMDVIRQYGQAQLRVSSKTPENVSEEIVGEEGDFIRLQIREMLLENMNKKLLETSLQTAASSKQTTSKEKERVTFESSLNITDELKKKMEAKFTQQGENTSTVSEEAKTVKKSNLKHIGIQTDSSKDSKKQKVQIDSKNVFASYETSTDESLEEKDEETQTPNKEKQD